MSDMFEPGTLSVATVKELLDAAYMSAEIDQDGDIVIREGYSVFVQVVGDGQAVRFMAQFSAKPEAPEADKLRFVNAVNWDLRLPRAALTTWGGFLFDHYIYAEGGLPRKTLMLTLRRFQRALAQAVAEDEWGVLA
jgi:hypothetical protein